MTTSIGTFSSVSQIKQLNASSGYFFFSPEAMRGFRTRVHNAVYGGCAFVTSEQFAFRGRVDPREYRVRVAMQDGSIKSLDFRFKNRSVAHDNARWLGECLRNGQVTMNPQTGEFTFHSVHGDAPVELS